MALARKLSSCCRVHECDWGAGKSTIHSTALHSRAEHCYVLANGTRARAFASEREEGKPELSRVVAHTHTHSGIASDGGRQAIGTAVCSWPGSE